MAIIVCPRCKAGYAAAAPSCPKCGLSSPEAPNVVTDPGAAGASLDADVSGALEAELRAALAPRLLLVSLLGQGGMGSVYLARDPALKRNVVVKVLAPWLAQDPAARARFEREAQSAAAVSHPGVVSVYQVGDLPLSGSSYFVMQHVDGATLEDAFPSGTVVPEARAKRVIGDIAAALAAAHRQGLVHRDIKPANVMLERETDRVVVLDFGISAAASVARKRDLGTKLTQEGSSIGTPDYMSPEQAAGEEVTDRSDVYSLGVLAFRLLAGRLPFEGASAMAMMAAHLKDTPPKLASLREDLDEQVAALVDRMLAKAPGARPAAEEVARALRPTGHAAIEWPPPGLEKLRGLLSRAMNYWLATVAAGVLYFAILGLQAFLPETAFLLLNLVGLIAFGVPFVAASLYSESVDNLIALARRSGYPLAVALDVGLDRFPDTALLLGAAGPFAEVATPAAWRLLYLRRIAAGGAAVGVLGSMAVVAMWAVGWLAPAPDAVTPIGLRTLVWMAMPAACGALGRWVFESQERRLRHRVQPLRPTGLELKSGWRATRLPEELVGSWLTVSARGVPTPRSWLRVFVSQSAAQSPALLLALAFLVAWAAGAMRALELPWDWRPSPGAVARWHRAVRTELEGPTAWDTLDAQVARAARIGTGPGDTAAVRTVLASGSNVPANLGEVWDALGILPGPLPDSLRRHLTVMGTDGSLAALDRLAAGGPVTLAQVVAPNALGRDSADALARRLRGGSSRLVARQLARAALSLAEDRRAEAEARVRTILALGWQLWRAPIPAAHAVALDLLDLGVRALREVGTVEADRSLLREADRLARVIESRRKQLTRMQPRLVETAVSGPDEAQLGRLIADRRLAPVDRWRLIEAVADGACWRPREVHSGVAPARRAALEETLRLASDLPQTADWVAVQRHVLDDVSAGRSHHPLAWLAFLPPVARSFACAGVRGGSP